MPDPCLQDTNSIDLSVPAGNLAADLRIDPNPDNLISLSAAGVFVGNFLRSPGPTPYQVFAGRVADTSNPFVGIGGGVGTNTVYFLDNYVAISNPSNRYAIGMVSVNFDSFAALVRPTNVLGNWFSDVLALDNWVEILPDPGTGISRWNVETDGKAHSYDQFTALYTPDYMYGGSCTITMLYEITPHGTARVHSSRDCTIQVSPSGNSIQVRPGKSYTTVIQVG
jgi:hypothetical protein